MQEEYAENARLITPNRHIDAEVGRPKCIGSLARITTCILWSRIADAELGRNTF